MAEVKGGYILWKGKAELPSGRLLHHSQSFPLASECLIKVHFSLNPRCDLTVINGYTLALTNCDEAEDNFYSYLDRLVKATPTDDNLFSC